MSGTRQHDRNEVSTDLALVHNRYRAGQKEVVILKKLADADPNDKRHLIRLERTFEHRGHLCLVFESLRLVQCEAAKHSDNISILTAFFLLAA